MPIRADDWSSAILKALSCGVPAIAYDLPTIAEHMKCNLVPSYGKALLADAVLMFFHDPQLHL
jgi:hypothetical protein